MKVSAMSDLGLSRWICEQRGWTVRADDDCPPYFVLLDPDGKMFARHYENAIWGFLPDMIHDSAMTLMLIETRFFYSVRKHPRGWVFTDEKGVERKHVNDLSVKSFGRATAERYALANGLEEG